MRKLRAKIEETEDDSGSRRSPKRPADPVTERVQLWFLSMVALIAGGIVAAFSREIGVTLLFGGVAGFLWFFFGPSPEKLSPKKK